MNPRTLQREDKAFIPILYMAMELIDRTWKLVIGDVRKRHQASIAAGDLRGLSEAVVKAQGRFDLSPGVWVVSCCEAGQDGFWLHRYLAFIGYGAVNVRIVMLEIGS